MNKPLFSITTEHDLLTGEVHTHTFVKVYESVFTSGIVARLGAQGFTTLLALATFMNEKGECQPTQEQIAERIGCHRNTANRYINELLSIKVDGNPIVTRTMVNKGNGKIASTYKINPVSQLFKATAHMPKTTDSNKPVVIEKKEKQEKPLNSKTGMEYFQQIYREVYNVNYAIGNYARDGKLLKDKVTEPFPDQSRQIIEIAVREYDKRWKNAKYPRPSIAMFSWIVNPIMEIIEEEKARDEVVAVADDVEAKAEAEMLAKLAKWGDSAE